MNYYISVCLLISVSFLLIDGQTGSSPTQYCTDLQPQNALDMDKLMGIWVGNEVLTHRDNDIRGEFIFNSCVQIHISDITEEMIHPSTRSRNDGYGRMYSETDVRPIEQSGNYRFLKLIWTEEAITLVYKLRYDVTKKGFWISSAPQKESGSRTLSTYDHFAGTIQVIKVVNDHMVLTFCQNLPDSKLFSILLTRHPQSLSILDIESVRGLLTRKHLSISGIRKVCVENGSSSLLSIPALTILFVFLSVKYQLISI